MHARSALGLLVPCVATAALVSSTVGCGGSEATPFRVGILSDCYGPFGAAHELNVAAAELPLIERGAELRGTTPSDGVGAVTVAGRRVELLVGCVAGTNEVIPEARRLVEENGAEAIVGPEDPGQGMALRLYARRRPGTAFLVQPSGAPELTLIDPARNVFRFVTDAAQSSAGLGTYAYRDLGWRTAAVVGDDVPYSWEQAAGFIAEFCALGGRLVDRVWMPFGSNPAAAAGRVPHSVDGVYLAPTLLPMSVFLKRFAALGRDLSTDVVAGASVFADSGVKPPPHGMVVAGTPALEPTPSARAYLAAFSKAFPSLPATQALTGLGLAYGQGVEAVLQALGKADGRGGSALLTALDRVQLESPLGRIGLDHNRQAIGPNYVSRVAPAGVTTLRVVPNVEQSFGGYLTGTSSPPSATTPACVKRAPPRWAR
jgi:branched-chain amino acid transport system substrate-binding protein